MTSREQRPNPAPDRVERFEATAALATVAAVGVDVGRWCRIPEGRVQEDLLVLQGSG